MTTDKTLADAKPGGCVQLPTSERERFEAWAESSGEGLSRWPDGLYVRQATQVAWDAWQAALSAHPSPGGQGDALLREVSAQLESLDCGACIGSDAPMEDLHGRIAAHLAARQPVGEPVSEKLMRLLRERAALPESVELSYQRDGDGTGRAWWDRRHAELEAQGYCLDFETDSGAEWYALRGIGDELRAALAEYDAAPPAQAVDLGRFRKLASWVANCAGHGINDSQRRLGEELLALIDGKVVGK